MPRVEETRLPGIGQRYNFETGRGRRLGVLVHRNGRRALLVYREDDPDECAVSLELEPDESRTLAELLGAPHVVEQLGALHQDVEGLRIDWITIEDDAEWAAKTLQEAGVHSNTGVSVVALVSDRGSIAAPGAEAVLEAGATAVVVGSPDGVDELARHLRRR